MNTADKPPEDAAQEWKCSFDHGRTGLRFRARPRCAMPLIAGCRSNGLSGQAAPLCDVMNTARETALQSVYTTLFGGLAEGQEEQIEALLIVTSAPLKGELEIRSKR